MNKRQKKKKNKNQVKLLCGMISIAEDANDCNYLFEEMSEEMALHDNTVNEFKNLKTDEDRLTWIQNNL